MKAMVFTVDNGQQKTDITLWENSWDSSMSNVNLGNTKIGVSYGNKIIKLPFSLHLDDFVIERYPGSMSPSSFSSFVQIHENGKEPRPYHIYMNNILKINGYRFFQSSYDNDEKGTILSVNHDPWGTGTTYFSYFLLVLGMLWSLINPRSFFRKTIVKDKAFAAILIFFFIFQGNTFAQPSNHKINAVEREHAEEFSKLKVQNNRGRTEPIHTYASAITRKITRKESIHGLSPAQLFLEMNLNPQQWIEVPIIRVKNPDLKQLIGITGNYAAYMDFISNERSYLLQQHVQKSYAKPPAQRTKFDKAVMKVDEKINICFGIFNGDYLRIFPVPGNPDSATWYTAHDAKLIAHSSSDSIFFADILSDYFEAVSLAKTDGNYEDAYKLLDVIKTHQVNNAVYELHSPFKIETEVFYNKVNPFKKLFPFYMALGLLHLILLIIFITIGRNIPNIINKIFFYTILSGFALHTIGIAARWYISGYAPMSNGYETMVFIAWVTVLAGFIFNKRSAFSLTATSVVAGLTLMVANLNFMDPVITNLVPVLQSYWLTIHVSVITAGYGFLALGAILGIINLALTTLRTNKNHNNIVNTILELTIINHKTLIVGLYLLTIGSFLGAVWANESWGRYWGWDPKETWALISILVYTLITHARLIPGMRGVFVFNTLSLWGFSSILMTFFGVNYYLSGLHSYAGGDPVPVPMFVYYTVFIFIVLSLAAWLNYNKFKKS
jgi:cytochrome c-type biogenesis protein CcsB